MNDKLYLYLGISELRMESVIKPFMDPLMLKGGKVDQTLVAIENNNDLFIEEKMYLAYCVGRSAAVHEINTKMGGLAKRLVGLVH